MYDSLAVNSSLFLNELNELDVFSETKKHSRPGKRKIQTSDCFHGVQEKWSAGRFQRVSCIYSRWWTEHRSLLSDAIAATINQFSADSNASPAAAKISDQTVCWLCDAMGYSPEAYGDITSQ